jgi:hypothetical protein
MATVLLLVDDYEAFWRDIVKPDYNDFLEKIDDLRRAFHCAITLFHLGDWIYIAHKASIDASFTFKDTHGASQPVYDEKTFANALRDLHPNFELTRGIANSAKHLQLKNSGPHPSAPTNAANTRVQSPGWQKGPYSMGPHSGAPRVMLEGSAGRDLELSDLARSVFAMWESLSKKHGWRLS